MDRQTDNQQRKVNEIEIAWLAGFMDGEGSIGIKVQSYHPIKKGNYAYFAPYVQIVNTHYGSIMKVDDILTRMHVGHHISEARRHLNPNGKRTVDEYKRLWRILINGLKRCKPFLIEITPYLVVKKEDAEMVIDFINSRESNYYKQSPYSQRDLDIVNRFRSVRRSGRANKVISLKSLNDYMRNTDEVKV